MSVRPVDGAQARQIQFFHALNLGMHSDSEAVTAATLFRQRQIATNSGGQVYDE